MTGQLNTTITELPESRVRVQVQVPADKVEGSVERKARELGRQLKIPGFRRGKVPASLVIQRIGRDAVLEEAVRDALGNWYANAIETSGIVPVGDPEIDLGDLPSQGEALEFSIEIGVLPKAKLGEYKGLEVGRQEVAVDEQQVEQEIQQLRERLAKLQGVKRPAETGDFVVIDYVGSIDGELFAGGEGRDQLVELGSGNLIPGFEEGLLGASASETREVKLAFPADYANTELAGRDASFSVTVKEVKHKELAALDEDFAADVGFDSLKELREDITRRLKEAEQERVESEFREAALDAAVAQAQIQTTQALIQARAREMWERMLHSLSHQGVSKEAYLQISSRSEEEILLGIAPDAEQALRREAVITAVVQAEGIEPGEKELLQSIGPTAEREGVKPDKLLDDLRRAGRLDEVRENLAAREAMDLIADQAKPIAPEQAAAREKLWTPEKAQAEKPDASQLAGEGLWTPDQ